MYSSDRGNLLSVAEAMYRCSSDPLANSSPSSGDVEENFETFGSTRCAEFTGGHFGGVAGGGGYNSSELQRFRTNTRRYRTCPLCGGEAEGSDPRCRRMLLEVLLDSEHKAAAKSRERERERASRGGGGGWGGAGSGAAAAGSLIFFYRYTFHESC